MIRKVFLSLEGRGLCGSGLSSSQLSTLACNGERRDSQSLERESKRGGAKEGLI